MDLAEELLIAIRDVIGTHEAFVPLHVPEFNGRERELILDCIDTGWVSSAGSYVDSLETEVARKAGCLHGVVVTNGTAALHIALMVCGVRAGDEVLLPTLTFVATANAISYLGAETHFVDSAYETMGICPMRLRAHLEQIAEIRDGETWNRYTGRRIRAIVPMHAFGCPVDMDGINSIAADWPMAVVEDAAESLGSIYKGKVCGSLGTIAAISFNGNKIVTTGGGGAIVTNDERLAKRAKHLTTTAKLSHEWAFLHDEVGFNFRMPNINAALGVAQLEQLDQRLEQKMRLYSAYERRLHGLPGVKLFNAPARYVSNNWLVTLILAPELAYQRDHILRVLNDAGVMSRPVWTSMHRLPMYENKQRADLSCAEDLERRIINIPSSAYLGAQLGAAT